MSLRVDSEVGRLRQVILHEPGVELSRMTPANVDELLFGDVMWAARAREEHRRFAEILREAGVRVHLFADLLTEALEVPEAREFLSERIIDTSHFGTALDGRLRELVAERSARDLSRVLIAGLLTHEMAPLVAGSASLVMSYLDDDEAILPPLPNHLFQRDNSAWIHQGVSINEMARPARRRETLNSQVIYHFHPMFAGADFSVYSNGRTGTGTHSKATVEGGDILVLGNGQVMVGLGERTTAQGVEVLARSLFAAGAASKVIVVELPREPAFMHLDTAMTMVDRDAFSVYPFLPENPRSFTLTAEGSRGDFGVAENPDLFTELARALEVPRVRVLRAPTDRRTALREQWDNGNNFLAVSPGVVIGYDRNTVTNTYLADQGIEVIGLGGSELARGRGGPRCMSCTIEREAVLV